MYNPYWLVSVPPKNGDVTIALHYSEEISYDTHTVDRKTWLSIKNHITNEMVERKIKFKTGDNIIDYHSGMEISLLLLAIEGVDDPAVIETACVNWHCFTPDERLSLYLMAKVATNRNGWLQALHFILCTDS